MQCGSAEHELFHRAAVKFNFYQIIISHRRHFHELAITKGPMSHSVADGKLRFFGRLGLRRGRRRNRLFEALLRRSAEGKLLLHLRFFRISVASGNVALFKMFLGYLVDKARNAVCRRAAKEHSLPCAGQEQALFARVIAT